KGQRCGEKTTERYQELLEYLGPALLRTKLSEITPRALEQEYDRLRESGGHDRKTRAPRPLSSRTVRHVHNTLRAAFNTAVRWKLLRENPAAMCEVPPVESTEAKALDPDELEWYLDAARGHWLYPILLVHQPPPIDAEKYWRCRGRTSTPPAQISHLAMECWRYRRACNRRKPGFV